MDTDADNLSTRHDAAMLVAQEETERLLGSLRNLARFSSDLDFAIQCAEELPKWKAEAKFWRAEHGRVVNDSIRHGEEMTGNILKLVLDGALRPVPIQDPAA